MSTATEGIPPAVTLNEEQARQILSQGEEAVVFALLQLAEQKTASAANSHQTPSAPSGMKPPDTKLPPKRRKKKPLSITTTPSERSNRPLFSEKTATETEVNKAPTAKPS